MIQTAAGPRHPPPSKDTRPPSPKRRRLDGAVYSYHAGYSALFVDHMLEHHCVSTDVVFDPWNGSGTTTERAYRHGIQAIGSDLNPAMVVVSRGRLLPASETSDAMEVLADACRVALGTNVSSTDPLLQWFSPAPASVLRGTFRAVLRPGTSGTDAMEALPTLSRDATRAWCVTALFIAIRRLLAPFLGSNPTWVRIPKTPDARLRLRRSTVTAAILDAAAALSESTVAAPSLSRQAPFLTCADSQAPPPEARDATAILSSPPYCTRIDYAVATRPELAVLGFTSSEQARLRQALMGNPNVSASVSLDGKLVSELGVDIVDQVEKHPSKASSTYYARWLRQYLVDYAHSLRAISTVCRHASLLVLVVQDSYYKTIPLPLARLTTDIAARYDWALDSAHAYTGHSSLAWINPASRRYRGADRPAETVLVLRRPTPARTT